MLALGLFGNVVRLPGGAVLRRPGETVYVWLAALFAIGFFVLGAVEPPLRLFLFAGVLFGLAAIALLRARSRAGLYVTDEVVWAEGPRREHICAAAPVAALRVVKVGKPRDYHLELEFRDAGAQAVGRWRVDFPGRYGTNRWKPSELAALAAALGWEFESEG